MKRTDPRSSLANRRRAAGALSLVCGVAALWSGGAAAAETIGASTAPRMKAVIHREYGPPRVLRLEEVERPTPGDDQLLVRVQAASVNPLDWHYMRGTPYFGRLGMGLLRPETVAIGVDFAGTVEAVGRSVTRFKVGDEVFGGRTGALAEYVTVRQDRAVALKPANVSFEQAASVPVAAVTALQALRDKGRLQAGQQVLINGASGGVGTFAVQIAKSLGAVVTGVCSTRNAELVRAIGADHVIDYTREDFTVSGVRYDLILDTVGNHSFLENRRALKPSGVYVMVGGPKGRWIAPLDQVFRALVVAPFVSQKPALVLAELKQQDLTTLADMMRTGQVTPVLDRRYPLRDASEAIAYLEKGHARGKVVVTTRPEEAVSAAVAGPAPVPGTDGGAGADVAVLALIAGALVVPIAGALALNRRRQRISPGARPYRWGYYLSIMSVIGGICLGLLLDSGIAGAIAGAAIYGALAWSFAQRRRWAWIALTALTFNPVVWLINVFYLRRRWAEAARAT